LPALISPFQAFIARLTNRFRRRNGPALRDQAASVIMRTCSLQLERGETRELAPSKGATGPMILSGGAITTISYRVFDKNADDHDKSIKSEPWRAFAKVTMRLTIERDPEFEVSLEVPAIPGTDSSLVTIEPRDLHKAPGLAILKHLSEYFPLLPRAYAGPVFHGVAL
jgi:hypothetical protein